MRFLIIRNRKNFLLSEVPQFNPASRRYLKWWRTQKKRCIEGFWSIDDSNVDVDIIPNEPKFQESKRWRYMPPSAYFYANFGTILRNRKGTTSGAKEFLKPSLDDVEWEFGYNWIEARGFSGFEFDKEYSCNRYLLEEFTDEELTDKCLDIDGNVIPLLYNNYFKKNGTRKKYIPVREYIRKVFDKPMGRPVYANEPKNLMILGTRDGGKSYLVANQGIAHEVLFDGMRYYEVLKPEDRPIAELVVGASISDKSTDLLKKVKYTIDRLPGVWKKGSDEEVPSPLYKHMSGNLSSNQDWKHVFEIKKGGSWQKFEGSYIKHRTFTTENPEAAAGGRPGTIVLEEVGLVGNLLAIHGCFAKDTEIRMYNGSLKKIQDIKVGDLVMGFDGTKRTVSKLFRGIDDMYKIKQSSGDDYIVNSKHRLYLEQNRCTGSDGFKTIEAKEYHESDIAKSTKKHTYGLKSGIIEFEPIQLELDPYFMGLYLGDGIVKSAGVCYDPKTDLNTQKWLIDYYKSLNLNYNIRDNKGVDLCVPIGIKKGIKNKNIIRVQLENYNTLNKKFLHPDFVKASIKDRLNLLAGLIDSDGTLAKRHGSCEYVFYQSGRKDLSDKVKFIARSLGFRVTEHLHQDKRKDWYKLRSQITITGGIERIPCKHPRKQVPVFNKRYNRSTVRTKINTEYVGKDNYYGFQLKEDDKLLLGDNTITYNSNDGAQNDSGKKFGSTLYIGTAGNMEKILEAELVFKDPKGFDFLEFDNIWEEDEGKICWFIPSYYMARDFKDENGNTKLEVAKTHFDKRRERKSRSSSKKSLESEKINYPFTPSEMFVNKTNNEFPISDIKIRIRDLFSQNNNELKHTYKGTYSINEDGAVKFEKENKGSPIREFPLKKDERDLIGCIEMFEPPVKNNEGRVPSGVYGASLDPVDDDGNDNTSQSLQSFYIINLLTDRIVLEYTARTKFAKLYYEQVRRALIDYNATLLYENQKKGIYTYFDQKNSLYLLEDTPQALKDSESQRGNFTGNRSKGVYNTPKIKYWGEQQLLPAYLEAQGYNKKDGVTNLQVFKSVGALREMIYYDGKINTDRISSLGILMILRELKLKHKVKIVKKKNKIVNDPFFNRHSVKRN